MHNVVRIPNAPPDLGAKFNGLVEKLLALRAEINSTLAEIKIGSDPAYGAHEAHASLVADQPADPAHYSSLSIVRNVDPPEEEPHLAASVDDADQTAYDIEDDAETLTAHEFGAAGEEPHASCATDAHCDDETIGDETAEIAEAAEGDMPTADEERADLPAQDAPAMVDASEAANPVLEAAVPEPGNDLTRIAGIDPAIALQLNAHGVTAYAQIAAWSAADVARISEALDIETRACKENWIEQAAILASGGSTAFTRGSSADAALAAAPAEDPNLRPYEHMHDALRATAAAELAETRIISLQEQRLKRAAQAAPAPGYQGRRRGRYAMATLATGFAASLGFAAVMLFDVDEIRARAAASETLRTLIHHTKRQFEPRPEPRDANTTGSDSASEDPNAQWILHMHMWPPGA